MVFKNINPLMWLPRFALSKGPLNLIIISTPLKLAWSLLLDLTLHSSPSSAPPLWLFHTVPSAVPEQVKSHSHLGAFALPGPSSQYSLSPDYLHACHSDFSFPLLKP